MALILLVSGRQQAFRDMNQDLRPSFSSAGPDRRLPVAGKALILDVA